MAKGTRAKQQDVPIGSQPVKDLTAGWRIEIESDAALAEVEREERRTLLPVRDAAGKRPARSEAAAMRRLDQQYVCTELR